MVNNPYTLSTDALSYLQRPVPPRHGSLAGPQTVAPPALRRLARVRAVGVPCPPATSLPEEEGVRTQGLLAGLAGHGIPLSFAVAGSPEGVALHLGTWSPRGREDASEGALDARQAILHTLLQAAYSAVDLGEPVWAPPEDVVGGLGLGAPVHAVPAPVDGTLPLDRIIRGLAGSTWWSLCLAEPVAPDVVAGLRTQVVNEMRAVEAAAQSSGAPSPLAEHYLSLLATVLARLTRAHASGAWRVGVYLLGDSATYHRLASTWRAAFTDNDSGVDPLQAVQHPDAAGLAAAWALPDAQGAEGPGHVRHPFAWQTLLDSEALAGFVHLPRMETAGFQVRVEPAFDAVPPPAPRGRATLALGAVVRGGAPVGGSYDIARDSLTRHALVAGITGSGKTNTVRHLLQGLAEGGTPFLVVEPAKREYRGLAGVRVLTPGDERVSPLRLNPLEVPEGTPVAEHLDLLRTVFAASFGMWTPLPQVLDRCLVEVYTDRGWDLASDRNHRLGDAADRAWAFPTLADLAAKVREVTPLLGYEQRVTDNLEAALVTRLDSLRRGGRGRMFDTLRSFPMESLLGGPTVVELEGLTDDDDKAFFAALLLVRLVEHRRTEGPVPGLRHLLVVEEAHRLLAAVPQRSAEQADPRGTAVQAFSHLLSEIRAYGQGVVLSDQVPARLAPDALKNTSLKITHRVVAADDQQALGATMAADDGQARAFTALPVGRAAVFGDGDDAPLLVQVPLAAAEHPSPSEDEVRDRMARWRASEGLDASMGPLPSCARTCAGESVACETASRLVGEPDVRDAVARTVLSIIEDAAAVDGLWRDIVDVVGAHRPPSVAPPALLLAVAGHASAAYCLRRGAQAGWSYADTVELAALLRTVLSGKATAGTVPAGDVDAFRQQARVLHGRDHDPFPACSVICDQDPPLCLYRSPAADLVASRRHDAAWRGAEAEDASSAGPEQRRRQSWEVAMDAGYSLIQFPEPGWQPERRETVTTAARRASLCFAQQMVAADQSKVPRSARLATLRVLREAGVVSGPSSNGGGRPDRAEP